MAADVTIVIDGDASGLVSAAQEGAAAMRPLTRSIDGVTAASAKAAPAARSMARELDDVKNVLKLLNPAAGEMGERFGGALRVMEGGTSKIAATGVAVGGLAIGFAAVAAASIKFASAVVATSRDVDNLAASLSEAQREALAPHIEALREANKSFDELEDAVTSLQIVIASDYVGTLADAATVTAYLLKSTDLLAEGFRAMGRSATDAALSITGIPGMGSMLRSGLGLAGAGLSGAAAAIRAQNDAGAEGLTFLSTANDASMTATAADPMSSPIVKAAKAQADAFADVWKEGFDQWMSDYDAAQAWVLQDLTDRRQKEFDAAKDREKLAAEENKANADRAKERIALEKAAAAERIAIERQVASANIAIASDYVGAVGGLIGTLAEASGASAEEVWQINHTAAMAQAALAIPLAALQGLSSGGPAAPALAAAYAGLAAIEFAAVAAQQPPSFHTGGLAPDEFHGGGYIGRTNEGQIGPAVLTAQGLDAMFGGQRGLAELNAGRAPEPAPIYLVVDGEPRRSRRFAGPTPGYGRTPFGGR